MSYHKRYYFPHRYTTNKQVLTPSYPINDGVNIYIFKLANLLRMELRIFLVKYHLVTGYK